MNKGQHVTKNILINNKHAQQITKSYVYTALVQSIEPWQSSS
jgi:hypothetical protein